MSFFWGKFEPPKGELDKEVTGLYSRRDVVTSSSSKGAQVNINNVLPHPDGPRIQGYHRIAMLYPSDEVWHEMTEDERIENGLPSKHYFRTFSPPFQLGFFALASKICNNF